MRGPLPQWNRVGGYGSGVYEASDPSGTAWRLRLVKEAAAQDGFGVGYRLAPRDTPEQTSFITSQHGLYYALDMAGMQIAADAVRADPEAALQQLGLSVDDLYDAIAAPHSAQRQQSPGRIDLLAAGQSQSVESPAVDAGLAGL